MAKNYNPAVSAESKDVGIDHAHPTSIVKTNPGNGALTVLEQNHGGNKEAVKTTAIRWKDAATKTTVTKKNGRPRRHRQTGDGHRHRDG